MQRTPSPMLEILVRQEIRQLEEEGPETITYEGEPELKDWQPFCVPEHHSDKCTCSKGWSLDEFGRGILLKPVDHCRANLSPFPTFLLSWRQATVEILFFCICPLNCPLSYNYPSVSALCIVLFINTRTWKPHLLPSRLRFTLAMLAHPCSLLFSQQLRCGISLDTHQQMSG